MKTVACGLVMLALLLSTGVSQGAVTWSTGDLGNNVIDNAGDFIVNPFINGTPGISKLTVKYGLWNSPDVLVSVLVNQNSVGSLLADQGYIQPGPEYVTFDISNYLQSGTNTILFTGFNQNNGDYVIGQVDVDYDLGGTPVVPAPGAFLLASMGVGMISWFKRKKAM